MIVLLLWYPPDYYLVRLQPGNGLFVESAKIYLIPDEALAAFREQHPERWQELESTGRTAVSRQIAESLIR